MTDKTSKVPERGSWKRFALEIASIIMGVLIALAVDEWNEEREYRAQARSAIQNLQAEMQNNLAILEIIHPENAAALAAVESGDTADDTTQIRPGLVLQDAAWKTLISSGVSRHVAYDQLFEISEIYTMQALYLSFAKDFVQMIQNARGLGLALNNDISEEEAINANVSQLGLMLTIETQLMESIASYLDD